jgi:sigma-B regulation protein RsbU (phosphoserine phosphatase)
MREKTYLVLFLVVAGLLLYLGHDLVRESVIFSWLLTFGGTATAGILVVVLYRFRMELRASRTELARKQAELDFARRVQRELFPRQMPANGGLEFSGICLPAAGISGDYYDVVELEDGRIVFAIADISGKGISAAILMANLQALLRAIAGMEMQPAEVCARLNRHLHQVTDSARYATMFYADWSPAERRLSYVNAGHNPPFLVRDGSVERLTEGGIPLGVLPETRYCVSTLTLEPGDLLALYSDGITEAGLSNGSDFGEKRLLKVLVSHKSRALPEIGSAVLEEVREWSGPDQEDDMTLMLVRARERA